MSRPIACSCSSWAGQHAAALRQYDECVRILADELDAPPEEETDRLLGLVKAKRLSPPTSSAEAQAVPINVQRPAPPKQNLPLPDR